MTGTAAAHAAVAGNLEAGGDAPSPAAALAVYRGHALPVAALRAIIRSQLGDPAAGRGGEEPRRGRAHGEPQTAPAAPAPRGAQPPTTKQTERRVKPCRCCETRT